MKRWAVIALLLLWLGWHLATSIALETADVGRHIKNGELLLKGTGDILYKNYYSYTHQNYSFINHHWLFGVFCYAAWHYLGFAGLSFIYLLLELLSFYLFFLLAERFSNLKFAYIFALFSIPSLVTRAEIRPEGFSMLFCGLFWVLLNSYQGQRLTSNYLKIALALLQVLWVNTHIFFFMGPLLTALFWCQLRMNGQSQQAKALKETLWVVIGTCLINPSGFWGALTPLNIFKGLNGSLIENQSIFILPHIAIGKVYFYYLFVLLGIMILPWIFLVKREGFKKHVFMLSLTFFMSIGAFGAIRLLSPWAFFMIPVSAYAWGRWSETWPKTLQRTVLSALLIYGIWASGVVNFNWKHDPTMGLQPGVNRSAQFFKQAGLQGPIFNNYDIGGYLIFHLSPPMKFFVDNRLEAFPKEFFSKEYLPMLYDENMWQAMEGKYHFNVIYFSQNDGNAYARLFLLKRLRDPLWAVVFADDFVLIFLKRNAQNKDLIERYQWTTSRVKLPDNTWGYKLDRGLKI